VFSKCGAAGDAGLGDVHSFIFFSRDVRLVRRPPPASAGIFSFALAPTVVYDMKPRDYCCCAVPIIDAGIYATLGEQVLLGVVVGTLALATPSSMSCFWSLTAVFTLCHSRWRRHTRHGAVDPGDRMFHRLWSAGAWIYRCGQSK
jgi:hypothetical protein